MKHLGDITKLRGGEIPAVDIITSGSPCQDLSIAGNQNGLDGERSKLFHEQIRIVKEAREHDRADGKPALHVRPRYCIWENVPGAFSSNGGADFQTVLTEFVRIAEPDAPDVPLPQKWSHAGCIYDEMGRWSLAWRLHDAQYFGVPQRRKRICVLADFNGLTAPEILFDPQFERTTEDGYPVSVVGDIGGNAGREIPTERESVSRDSEPCGAAREGTAEGTESGAYGAISFQERAGKPGGGERESSCRMNEQEPCQRSTINSPSTIGFKQGNSAKAGGIGAHEEISPTLQSASSGTNQVPACLAVDCRNGNEQPINGTLQAKSGGGRQRQPEQCHTND